MVAAAVVGSAVIGAGASSIAGSKASKAQRQAAAQQAQVEREGIALQERQFQQSRADLEPWREAGKSSLAQLQEMLKPGWSANNMESDPAFAFRREQGIKAIESSAAARGQLESGSTLKALARFGSGLASEEYGNRFNRLSALAGTGQTATSTTSALGSSFANSAQQGLSNIGGTYAAAGNARASSYANAGQAIGNAANSIGGYFTQQSTLNKILAQQPRSNWGGM